MYMGVINNRKLGSIPALKHTHNDNIWTNILWFMILQIIHTLYFQRFLVIYLKNKTIGKGLLAYKINRIYDTQEEKKNLST